MSTVRRTIGCILFGVIGISCGCAERGHSTVLSWNSPRLLDVKSEWDRLLRGSPDKKSWTKDEEDELERTLSGVLTRRLSKRDLWELARSCDVLPVREEDRSPFARAVLEHIVSAFAESGDRKSLVVLLSTRCPDRLGPYGLIEGYIALSEKKDKLEYPVLVLGDAYSRCKVPAVKRKIAEVVRRGFSTMDIPALTGTERNDDEYVTIAMKWYRIHKDELVPNRAYCSNRYNPEHAIPLFTWKAAGEHK